MLKKIVLLSVLSLLLSSCGAIAEPIPTPVPTNTPFPSIGKDITVVLPEGNPEDGAHLAGACNACHGGLPSNLGPAYASSETNLTITARAAERIADPEYTGNATSVQEYIVESIVDPLIYIVPGDWKDEDLMDKQFPLFSDSLTAQNVADLIAWMYTIE